MNDKELADRVVALGGLTLGKNNLWYVGDRSLEHLPICRKNDDAYRKLMSDWRVAGALIDLCDSIIITDTRIYWQAIATRKDQQGEGNDEKSIPKAIIEACCEALEGASE